jgi:hypothetical protein
MFGVSYFGNPHFGDTYFGPKVLTPTGGSKRKRREWYSEDEEFYKAINKYTPLPETQESQTTKVKEIAQTSRQTPEMALILAIYEAIN